MNILLDLLIACLVIAAPLFYIGYIERHIDPNKQNNKNDKIEGAKQFTDNKNP